MDWVPAQEEGMPALHYACMNESTEPAEMLGMGVSFVSRKRFAWQVACCLSAVGRQGARGRVATICIGISHAEAFPGHHGAADARC